MMRTQCIARGAGRLWRRLAVLATAAMLATQAAAAGEYSISPLRITLDREMRSSAVTLTNTGDSPLDFQVAVMEWQQDPNGLDRYVPTSEIVFFPKILTIRPGENRVVRIGSQSIPTTVERTFRLFVEPIPKRTQEPLPPGANVAVQLRFALPIFVKPPKSDAAGEIEGAALRAGMLSLVVRNTGNEHLRFDDGAAVVGLDAQGREVLAHRLDVRYVLAGAARPLTFPVPKDVCARLASLEITARAEQLTLRRQLAANRADCE